MTRPPRQLVFHTNTDVFALCWHRHDYAKALRYVTQWKVDGLLDREDYDCLGELILRCAYEDQQLGEGIARAREAVNAGQVCAGESLADAADPQPVSWFGWIGRFFGMGGK